jgi:transcriptional repressor NrdR
MKCIYCGHTDSKVIDSRSTTELNSIRRRRECLGCKRRFTTYETVETTPLLVVKTGGVREAFDREKMKKGIMKSTEKRPVTMAQIDDLVTDIEKAISNNLSKEVSSAEIGEFVMQKLKDLDQIAYVRFASVYKDFKDLTNFKALLDEL